MIFETFLLLFILTVGIYVLGGLKGVPLLLLVAGIMATSLGFLLFTDGVAVSENFHVYRNELDSNRVMDLNATHTVYVGSLDSSSDKKTDSGLFALSMILFFTGLLTIIFSMVPLVKGRAFG